MSCCNYYTNITYNKLDDDKVKIAKSFFKGNIFIEINESKC